MHDNQVRLAGWPDLADQASVVRTIKQTQTFSKPEGTEGNWNLVLQNMPNLTKTQVNLTQYENNVLLSADTTTQLTVGASTAISFASAVTNISILEEYPFNPDVETKVIALPPEVASGNGRLIAMGMEAINTTSTLNVQGNVHSYRLPQEQGTYATYAYQQSRAVTGGTGTYVANTPFSGRQVQWFPATEQEFMLLPGTRTWHAKEGCYTVVPFESTVNPIQPMEYVQPMIVDEFERSDLSAAPVRRDIATTYPLGGTAALSGMYYPVKWAPVHSGGMWFSGLSDSTTITLQVNMVYEYFPTSKDVSLVTMATPSACYDPVALEMYSLIMSSLPVGVMAKENGLGGWFADCVAKFGASIGAALTPIFGPAAAGAGMAASQLANSYLASNSPQNKPKLRQYTASQIKELEKKAIASKPASTRGPAPTPPKRVSSLAPKINGAGMSKAQRKKLRKAGVLVV